MNILNAIGKNINALPVINSLLKEGKSDLCYLEVLGKCTHPKCIFAHVPGAELPIGFVNEICVTIKPGVEYVTRNDLPAPQPRIKDDPRRTKTGGGGNKSAGGKRPATPGPTSDAPTAAKE